MPLMRVHFYISILHYLPDRVTRNHTHIHDKCTISTSQYLKKEVLAMNTIQG